jgi:hypothetical protein
MSLSERVRKFFLNLGFGVLPWVAFGTIGVGAVNSVAPVYDSQGRETGDEAGLSFVRRSLPITGAAAGLSLLGAYVTSRARRRRVVREPHRGLDKLLDHPGSLAPILAAGATAAASAGSGLFSAFPRYPILLGSLLATTTAALWYIVYMGIDKLSQMRSPCLLNFAKFCGYVARHPFVREKKCLELLAVESDDTLEMRASVAAYERNSLDALYYWSASMRWRERRSEVEEAVAWDWIGATARKLAGIKYLRETGRQCEKEPNNRIVALTNQYFLLRFRKESRLKQLAERILAQSDCTDYERLFESYVLDSIGERAWAESIRKDVLPRILRDKESIKLGKSLVYSKPGREEDLRAEAKRLEFLLPRVAAYDVEVARPLGILPVEDKHYLFEVFSDGESLYSLLEQNPVPAILQKADRAIAAVHGLLPHGQPLSMSEDIAGFIKKVPWEIGKKLLTYELEKLLKPLWHHQAANGDMHRENSHYNLSEQVTIYDKESVGSCPIAFDYAKMHCQGRRVGTRMQECKILGEAAEEYNSMVVRERWIPSEKLFEYVLRSSQYKALRFAVFVRDKPARHGAALAFLANATADLDSLHYLNSVAASTRTVIGDALKRATDDIISAAQRQTTTSRQVF